jgi:phage terminase large subunit-like protein
VAKIAARMGKPFMPWQQYVSDVAYEIDPATGVLAYRELRLTVPRQSGKTTITLARRVHRCNVMGPRQVSSYTAQTGVDARKKFVDEQLPLLLATPFGKLFQPRLTNGHEALIWNNGSIMNLVATTEKSGHGGTVDDATIDEAFAQPDSRIEQSLRPAMITRSNAQLLCVSTMGWLEGSEWWHGKVDDGRDRIESGRSSKVAYFDWSAPDDADADDEETWWACMPALGHTIPIDAIRAERDSMSDSDFRRAYLNQRVSKSSKDENLALPLDRWLDAADPASQIVGPMSLAIDMTPDRAWTCIGAFGFNADAEGHVEVIDHRPGSSWLVDRMASLSTKWGLYEVALDSAGPAASLVPDLEDSGFTVRLLNTTDVTTACASMYDALIDGRVHHINQASLTAAVTSAKRRPIGDRWAYGRKASASDISPIVAVTFARHVHEGGGDPGVWFM